MYPHFLWAVGCLHDGGMIFPKMDSKIGFEMSLIDVEAIRGRAVVMGESRAFLLRILEYRSLQGAYY